MLCRAVLVSGRRHVGGGGPSPTRQAGRHVPSPCGRHAVGSPSLPVGRRGGRPPLSRRPAPSVAVLSGLAVGTGPPRRHGHLSRATSPIGRRGVPTTTLRAAEGRPRGLEGFTGRGPVCRAKDTWPTRLRGRLSRPAGVLAT